jgi:magnesium transporter
MLKRFVLSNGQLVPTDSSNSPILVFVNPAPDEISMLLNEFLIDEHTLQSAMDPEEVPRIEINSSNLSLIWKRPLNYSGQDNFYFNVASVGLFLVNDRLAVVLTEDISIGPTGARKVHMLDSPLSVLLAFLYETIYHYLGHLKVIKMISRDIQKKINASMENKHLIQMFNLSESLVYYADAINGNNVVLTRLRTHAEKIGYDQTVINLLDDLIIENNQCFRQAEIYSTVFSGLMDARGNLVNNNMNILLKNLTFINVVFLPLNLIAGIFGMSEYSMITSGTDWRISYAMFFLAMVIIGVFTAFILGKLIFSDGNLSRRKRKQRRISA